MVFKKPYAFLIKNFKLLHLILAGLMIYLSVRINLITNLFNNLVRNVSVSLAGLSDKYISILMFLAIIVITGIGFVIWFLMKSKKKPNKYYMALLSYYILLFIFLMVFNSAMQTLEETAMTNQALRAYRDIAFLVPLGQYYFIVIAILRGIGFNIKQFNFSKDIKDLEISEEDSEEIELSLSSDIYKYERAGRKRIRELKYYFFENKFWILIICGIAVVIGAIYFFVNYKFVNNNYGERSFVNAGNYSFQVNKTVVTDKNIYGSKVEDGKKYVIVDLSIRNIFYQPVVLDTKQFRLFVGSDDFYYSISHKNSEFKDLGLPYDNKSLDLETMYNYILIYELEEDVSIRKLKLRVFNKLNYDTNKVDYININLNPIKLDETIESRSVNFNETIKIDEGNYGETSLVVDNYALINHYEYSYESCVNNRCTEKTSVISPNDLLNNKLVDIEYTLNLDKESIIYNFIKNDSNFFNTFATISYTLNGNKKNIKFIGNTSSHVKGKIFAEVPKDIENAESIELIINTRKIKYVYKLK